MKLKTVKDLEIETIAKIGNKPVKRIKFIVSYDLRQEAIKWIKALDSVEGYDEWFCLNCFWHSEKGEEGDKRCYGTCLNCKSNNMIASLAYETTDIQGAMQILKHFFNIQESEL